jgi:hypothetical protein
VQEERRAVDEAVAALQQRTEGLGDLEARRRDLDRLAAELAARESELDRRRAQLDAREEQFEHLSSSAEEERRALDEAVAALQEREAGLGEMEERQRDLDRLAEELAARSASSSDRLRPAGHRAGSATSSHVLFVPGERYRIVAVDGPPPTTGTEIAFEGARFTVARTGLSLLPGDDRLWLYLERVTQDERAESTNVSA